jgi:murein DD-endopeptidase MepM/ murein hydrolase activator NlpD
VVVIDHGWAVSTVYAHLSSLLVQEREAVRAGTPLGRVGNSWTARGYGFHFEIRVDGAAKDPRDYLKKF